MLRISHTVAARPTGNLLRCRMLFLAGLCIILTWSTAAQSAGREVLLPYGRIDLVGRLDLAPGKTLADGVVLMLHGTTAHGEMGIMRQFSGLFNENGLNTLAINFSLNESRRRGMFDCARPSSHRAEDALPEIGAWLDWLKGQGAGGVVLFGFSRGGHQAAWFDAERPHALVKSMVLLAPVAANDFALPERYQARFKAPIAPVLAKARKLAQAGKGGARLEKIGFLNCDAATATAASFLSYYDLPARNDTPELLKRTRTPALVLVAGSDEIARDSEQRLGPLMDGARLRMKVVAGADHFFRDLFGEDAMEAIMEHLRPK